MRSTHDFRINRTLNKTIEILNRERTKIHPDLSDEYRINSSVDDELTRLTVVFIIFFVTMLFLFNI